MNQGRFAARPKRVVVKVGTSSITNLHGEPERTRMRRLAKQVAALHTSGQETVLVSSGAIAAGLGPLRFEARPSDMPSLQAAAAVGQGRLMDLWSSLFEPLGIHVAQILLTQYDIVQRKHYLNARNTMNKLLALGCLPIVNENDSVATEEIRYGDNDRLAALVANIVSADLLVMLSDVEGLHASDPRRGPSELIPVVDAITPEIVRAAKGSSSLGSGGMTSKLEAARIATASGVDVVIASADRPKVLTDVVDGSEVGTHFPARKDRLKSRKLWIAFAPSSRGQLFVDAGAVRALIDGNKSLLSAGISKVEGSFDAGDAVEVVGPDGVIIAKGLVSFGSQELDAVAGGRALREVIHRDQLVVL